MRIIACIEDPAVIEKILAHLVRRGHSAEHRRRPARRRPNGRLFFLYPFSAMSWAGSISYLLWLIDWDQTVADTFAELVDYRQGDATDLPFADASCDIVWTE